VDDTKEIKNFIKMFLSIYIIKLPTIKTKKTCTRNNILIILSRIIIQENLIKMNIVFGEYIKSLRKQKGLTLTQLGAKLGIDSGLLSKIENGKKQLDEKALPNLAEEFNLDLQKLKNEYLSEVIAYKIYTNDYSTEVLHLAEEKVKYYKQKNVKQTSITSKKKLNAYKRVH